MVAYEGWGVWALVSQYLGNAVLSTIFLSLTTRWCPSLSFSASRFATLFSYGWKLMAAGFIGAFFNELKGLIIGIKYKPADLAFYNRGESIPILFTNNVNATIDSVIFPALSKIQDDKIKVKNAISRALGSSSFLLFPLLLGLAATADYIVEILLTSKWSFCVPYMRICCITCCFSIVGSFNLQALKAIGKSDIILKLEFYKKPLFLLLLFAFMPFGPLYICVANMIYSIAGAFINAFPNRKYIDYPIWMQIRDVVPHFFVAMIMAAIVYAIGLYSTMSVFFTLILQLLAGVLIYVSISIVLKSDSLIYIYTTIKTTFTKKNK